MESVSLSGQPLWSVQTLAVPCGVVIAAVVALVGVILSLRAQSRNLAASLETQRETTQQTMEMQRLIAQDERLWQPRSAVYESLIAACQSFLDSTTSLPLEIGLGVLGAYLEDRPRWITWSSNRSGIQIENLRLGVRILIGDIEQQWASVRAAEALIASDQLLSPNERARRVADAYNTANGQLSEHVERISRVTSELVLDLKRELQAFHERSS